MPISNGGGSALGVAIREASDGKFVMLLYSTYEDLLNEFNADRPTLRVGDGCIHVRAADRPHCLKSVTFEVLITVGDCGDLQKVKERMSGFRDTSMYVR